ncbi:MAG: lipase family protein [Defluviitaleaceae bacterium]|nr:lipase family protein [Defluviitaleaceae bacterium]
MDTNALFTHPPTEYNHNLALFAAWLSEYAYSQQVAWFFPHGEEFNYGFSPHRNSVAHTIAHTENLIIVVIRGTPEGPEEWISNFNVGFGEVHTGFLYATNNVYHTLMNYIAKHNVMSNIMLITGHSRGGAVANLLGARLNRMQENPYVYTFGAPRVSRTEATRAHIHSNIFNIINSFDPVIHLPPSVRINPWRRYGRDFDIRWLNRNPFHSHELAETYIAWLDNNNPRWH